MWNLPMPDVSGVRHDLDSVFPDAPPPALVTAAEKDAIEELYEAYRVALGRPSDALLGDALSAELRQAVLNAYKEVQDKGKLAALRNALKLLATECPYCGFGQIQDLDHHLPKAIYKPFSIFPLNLVPCCTTCNRGKPRKPKENPGMHMLHAFLEDLSGYDFLVADVRLDPATGSLTVDFQIDQPAGMEAELHARLLNHLDDYDLHERYPAQVNIYLGSLDAAFELAFESGGAEGLRSFLIRSSEKNAQRFGRNDWRTALLRGLSASDAFCSGGYAAALGHAVVA